MTDLEIYTRWLHHYDAMEAAHLRGDITLEAYDRTIRNMEERLGVDKWSLLRWHHAQNTWYNANKWEEGGK